MVERKLYKQVLDEAWQAHLAPRASDALTVVSLFAGCGGSSLGYAIAGYRELLAVEWDKTACASFRANFPGVPVYEGDVTKLSVEDALRLAGIKVGELDVLDSSPPCFAAGTPVVALRGVVPIESVVPGDVVLTHKCRWRIVLRTMQKVSPTVMVDGRIEATPEHEFWARVPGKKWNNAARGYRRVLKAPAWVRAAEMHGMFGSVPIVVDAAEVPHPPDGCAYDAYFWYAVGRWVGDGWVRIEPGDVSVAPFTRPPQHTSPVPCLKCGRPSAPNRRIVGVYTNYCSAGCRCRYEQRRRRLPRYEVHVCTSHADADVLGVALGKLGVAVSRSFNRTTVRFTLSRKAIAEWLVRWFGRGAGGKTMPGWVLGMRREWRSALFRGYMDADGSASGKATTVSRCLASAVALLGYSLGKTVYQAPEYLKRRGTIEGRTVNVKPQWSLKFTDDDGRFTEIQDGLRWRKVRRPVKPCAAMNVVFCVEVEEDNSFVADTFVVHNCQGFSSAGKRIMEDPRNSLFRETVRLLRGMKPRAFVMENVSGMVKGKMKMVFAEIMRELKASGYRVRCQLLNAMWYGVPQSRERVIFIGIREDLGKDPEFPVPGT